MNANILLAISGGIDSMVMLHRLLDEHGAEALAVAHCNFKLRGEESEGDYRFVEEECVRLKVAFHLKEFDTSAYAAEHGVGTQEAARDLRYSWFKELMDERGYTALATAHHSGDAIESFFINLLRGTGPQGLRGIKGDEGRGIIRPIMDMDRKEIERYAAKHRVKWREDRSNSSKDYLRNKIRLDLVPKLQELRPGFDKVMLRNMEIQSEVSEFIKEQAESYRKVCFLENENRIRIQPDGRKGEALLIKNLLRGYGFSETQLMDILSSSQSGKQVYSSSHVLTSHRGSFLLSPLTQRPAGPWTIDEDLNTSHLPSQIEATILDVVPSSFNPDPNLAYLDVSKLKFPLSLRYWKEGDRFVPLGMMGVKKLSDFLVDEKVSLEQKKNILVLESQGEIVWVVGFRISESLKVNSETSNILHMRALVAE